MDSTTQRGVHPSPALVRGLLVAAVGGLGGLVAHRADVLVVAVPIIVWLCWAALTRHGLDDAPGTPAGTAPVQLTPSHAEMLEGDRGTFQLEAPPGCVVGAVLMAPDDSALVPRYGAIVGAPGDLALEFEPHRWGRLRLGPAHVLATDESGAWRREFDTAPSLVRVRPPASWLVGGSGVARPIGISGMHRSAQRGEGTDVAGVREFVPGDRLRRINWKVSSRTRQLHVTQTYMERDTDILIVTDTLVDLVGPRDRKDAPAVTSLDATVHASAAIVQHYVGFGDRVAVHDLGTRIGNLPSGTGARQARLLLDQLARAHRDTPPQNDVQPVPRLASGTLVFACSPLLNDDVLAELLRLRRLGAELVVIDTMPDRLGHDPLPGRDPGFLTEGWTLRRMEHDETVARLRGAGIPVTRWEGSGSLVGVLLAMESSRTAPHLRGGM